MVEITILKSTLLRMQIDQTIGFAISAEYSYGDCKKNKNLFMWSKLHGRILLHTRRKWKTLKLKKRKHSLSENMNNTWTLMLIRCAIKKIDSHV